MKKTIAALAAIVTLGLGSAATAQDLFKANEVNLLVFGDYVDRQDDEWGGGLGINYFFSRYIGLGASSHVENFSGSAIDNVAGEVYLRMPLGRVPVAPYGVGTGGYSFDYERWFYGGGGGLEWRLSKEVGIFGDWQYLFYDKGDFDGWMVRFGFRLGM
jgi:hypothetical protein